MGVNRGKMFEDVVKQSFELIEGLTIDRIPDQMSGRKGSTNVCDFVAYLYPNVYYLECKTTYGNTLPFSNITDNQWKGLLNKSQYPGVFAGIICWWIDRDVTAFINIKELEECKRNNYKSIRYDHEPFYQNGFFLIDGLKKRVFFDYDFVPLLEMCMGV